MTRQPAAPADSTSPSTEVRAAVPAAADAQAAQVSLASATPSRRPAPAAGASH